MSNSSNLHNKINQALDLADSVIIGKKDRLLLAFCCFLSKGHLLIEDVPGVGKTSLVKLFAKLLGLESSRVQFTNDLIPADILGTSIYSQKESRFIFQKGPIFTSFLIADELNRASPKTQSALLQAMAEYQVSVDGETYPLDRPFFVVATQNPKESYGTYPLPESQIDRFLMRINLGYPSLEAEKTILKNLSTINLDNISTIFTKEDLTSLFETVGAVRIDDRVYDYLLSIAHLIRAQGYDFSTRANIQFLNAAKAMAYIDGRDFVIPEDVKACAQAVINHRIFPELSPDSPKVNQTVENIMKQVKIT